MKNKKILIAIVALMGVFFTALPKNLLSVQGETNEIIYEEKTYNTATLDQDFTDDCVLVTMDKAVSEINKVYEPSFFGDIDLLSVEDLTYMSDNGEDRKYLNREEFRQIIKLNLKTKSKENVLAAIEELQKIDGIVSAEPNYLFETESIPNDTYYQDKQWSFKASSGRVSCGISIQQAWDITKGNSEIRVGVIDTGIASHSDLNANVADGYDYYNNDTVTTDDPTGHGTHVAGIIGAIGNNNKGVSGICPNVTLVPMQVAYQVGGAWKFEVSSVLKAIADASSDTPILNYSGGSIGLNESEGAPRTWEDTLKMYNGLFVCAAGNNSNNNDTNAHYPSEYSDETNRDYNMMSSRIISVGASNTSCSRLTGTNYGAKTVSVYAPGGNIYSTSKSGGYELRSGTSMAAPHVAGLAALMLSANPNLTAAQIKDIICETVDEKSSLTNKCVTGGIINAFKALNACIDGFETNEAGDTITGLNFTPGESLLIPNEIDGTPITNIQSLGNKANNVSLIVIPEGVTVLGSNLFRENYNTTLYFDGDTPPTGGYLGNVRGIIAFYTNDYKTAYSAYANKIYSNGYYTDSNDDPIEHCVIEDNILIHYYGLYEDFTIPNIVTSISEKAFRNCSTLKNLTFEDGTEVTVIEDETFAGCSSLSSVELPSTITQIKDRAFDNCESLSAIAFPSSVTGIWSTAFQNCSSLNGITVDSANTTYKSDGNCVIRIVDNCLVLGGNSTIIPNYVTKIGENAFYNRDNLTNIVIPANVTIISNDAFYDCSNLSSLVFASNSQLNTVGSYAFYNCQKLTSVTIPDSVFVIDFGAFKNCTSLGTVQMPSNGILEHIDEQAFANTNIAYIVLPKTIRTVGLSVFKDCGNLLYVFIDGKFEDGDYFTYIEGSEEFSQLLPMFDGCNNLKAIFVSSAEDWGHYGNLWEDLSSKMIILESQNTAVFSTHMCLLFDTGKFTEIYFIDSDNLEDYVAALSFYAESGYTLIFYLPNEEYLAYVPQGIEDYNYVIIFEESNTIYGSMHEPIPN